MCVGFIPHVLDFVANTILQYFPKWVKSLRMYMQSKSKVNIKTFLLSQINMFIALAQKQQNVRCF